MELLLTILSVLAAWTFLGVLFLGLLLIRKVLESVHLYLEKIAMGVRAIETQIAPTRDHADQLETAFRKVGESFSATAERFTEMERRVKAVPIRK